MWNGGGEGHAEGSVDLYKPPPPPHMPHFKGKKSEVLSKHAMFLLNSGVLLLPALANNAHLALLTSYTLRCAWAILLLQSALPYALVTRFLKDR
jgi:hypothetical protein